MPRGQDSRHDSSRQVSRDAIASRAAAMPLTPSQRALQTLRGGLPQHGEVYPAGGAPDSIEKEIKSKKNKPAPSGPTHGPVFDMFPDPERAVEAMQAIVDREHFVGGLMQNKDAGSGPGSSSGLVDKGLAMPASGQAIVKGDTKTSFDPSILVDQRRSSVKKAEKDFQKRRTAAGRPAAAESAGTVKRSTASAARKVWGEA